MLVLEVIWMLSEPGPSTPSVPPTTPVPTNPTSCANGGVLLEADGK